MQCINIVIDDKLQAPPIHGNGADCCATLHEHAHA